jgi:O-antigen polymerase
MPTVMRKKRAHNPEAQSGTSREPVNGLREEIVSLIPEWLFYPLICISLVVPNLVFSPGATFFQSLHILKWTTALVPIGILSAVTGVMIVAGSQKRKDFLVDPLGWMWLFLLLYITAQPAWLSLSSIPTFVREWMFFASLFITMLLCVNFFRRRDMFMLVLFGAGLNAAVNVLFAELQVRMSKLPAFVLPVPGNYVGNTGQQNMLGIWVAMALLSGLVLHLMLMEERRESRAGAAFPALIGLNMVLLGVNAWGLFSTTSRQSLLAFAAGIFILLLMGSWLRGKSFIKALVPVLLIILLAMGAAYQFNTVRTQVFVEKAESLAKGAVGEKSELSEADSGRLSIYATAWTMLKKHPFLGVGIGHFKWNYLDAQRDLFRRYPDSKLKWQYTMWAHSELFHWFCEMGFIGGIFLLGILGWCAWCIVKTMIAKKRVSLEGLWAVALLTLIWTVALWGERPFHRIEDALWLSLAFAFLGREFLPEKFSWTEINRPLIWKGFGLVVASTAMAGLVFLGNGLRADHALAQAMRSRDSQFQESMLEKAARSLMVRDLSDRAHAEHYLALATARKDGRALAEGLARLEAYFMRQPQTRELNALISWYGRLGNREKLEIFTSYLKPGSYSIKPAGIPSSGK